MMTAGKESNLIQRLAQKAARPASPDPWPHSGRGDVITRRDQGTRHVSPAPSPEDRQPPPIANRAPTSCSARATCLMPGHADRRAKARGATGSPGRGRHIGAAREPDSVWGTEEPEDGGYMFKVSDRRGRAETRRQGSGHVAAKARSLDLLPQCRSGGTITRSLTSGGQGRAVRARQ